MSRLLFSFLMLGGLAFVLAGDEKYPTKYDNIDVDKILENERIFKNYVDCCLDKGKCTSEGLELKKHIKDAMETSCEKCSDTQKKAIKKVGKKLYKEKPEWWKELCDHYDPDHKYRNKFKKFIEEAKAEADD